MRPPAGLCPPNAEMQARAFRPEGGAAGASAARKTLMAYLPRSAGPAQPAGYGSLGSGAHLAARGHVLRARGACRGPRAKLAGRGLRACAPRPPRPHPVPGASAARGRECAVRESAEGRLGRTGPTGAPEPLEGYVGSLPNGFGWKKLRGFRLPASALPFGRRVVSALRGTRGRKS